MFLMIFLMGMSDSYMCSLIPKTNQGQLHSESRIDKFSRFVYMAKMLDSRADFYCYAVKGSVSGKGFA